MQNEVYADLLFLVNFSMDFLCFYLCARLLRRPLSLWRGVLASAFGGAYGVAALLWSAKQATSLLLDMAVCAVLCAIAMRSRGENWRSLLRLTGLYLLISSLLGGVMTLLFSKLNRLPGVTDDVVEEGLSAWIFLGMAVVSAALTWLWGRGLRRTAGRQRVTVIVEHGGRRAELEGMLDSGNLLRDPISGKVVIPIGAGPLHAVAPPALLRAVASGRVEKALEGLPVGISCRIRLIPAHGATGECLMLGWSPDHVYLRGRGEKTEREVSALVALSTSLERRGEVEALVPPELMSI